MYQYEVAIVGGGPAGSSLAFSLQRQGISCCIIDRARFPREKLCGGLLTEKTVSLLEQIYGNRQFPYERISTSVSLFFRETKLSNVTTQSRFYLVERKDFDDHLLRQFKERGGSVFEGVSISGIDQSQHLIELQDHRTISYQLLVGADGANSYVRTLIDPDYRPNAICVEAAVPSGEVDDEICVFFTAERSGYGWCFPKSDHYTVGMGGDAAWNRNIKDAFVQFAERIGKPVNTQTIRGAAVPFGRFVRHPYSDDILLIGDAAGLVDPITGEGLYFAFRSAMLASAAIWKKQKNGTPFKATYGKDIQEIHAIIRDANQFNRTYFSYRVKNKLLPLLEGRENIVRYYCENLLAKYNVKYMRFPVKYYFIRLKRKLGER